MATKRKIKLSKFNIDKLSYQEEVAKLNINGTRQDPYTPKIIFWDVKLDNFGLRLYNSGRKSFVIFYRDKWGSQKTMTLGDFGPLTAEQARELARDNFYQVSKGEDPASKRKEDLSALTLELFAQRYLKDHSSLNKTNNEDKRRLFNHILPILGKYKIQAIDGKKVQSLITRIGEKTPVEANRCLSLLSSVFNRAIEWSAVTSDWTNPTKYVKRFKEKSRSRFIDFETELPKLYQAIMDEQNIYIRALFLLYFFTGARKSELLQAKWIDLRQLNGTTFLQLEDSKAGEPQKIFFTLPVVKILGGLPRIKDNPHIFVGTKEGKHLINVSKAWNRVKKRANLHDIHIHDIRRSFGSYLVQGGHSRLMAQKLLRHKNAKTTEIYTHLTDREPILALESQSLKIEKVFSKLSDS